jgi:hypothetical protein
MGGSVAGLGALSLRARAAGFRAKSASGGVTLTHGLCIAAQGES